MRKLLMMLALVGLFAGVAACNPAAASEDLQQSTLDEALAKAVGDVSEGVAKLSSKLESLATEHGQVAWDLALNVARVQAASEIFAGLVALMIFLICLRFFLKGVKMGGTPVEGESSIQQDDREVKAAFIAIPSAIIGLISFVPTFLYLKDLWSWIGIVYPELYIAHQVMEKL